MHQRVLGVDLGQARGRLNAPHSADAGTIAIAIAPGRRAGAAPIAPERGLRGLACPVRRPVVLAALFAFGAFLVAEASPIDTDRAGERARMVDEIETTYARIRLDAGPLAGHHRLDPRVLDAMRTVRRHLFVPPDQRHSAYRNRPLDIGHGQTISQPFIVALMTDLLRIRPESRVLEVGTGSGYQAAVLGQLARKVHSIEIVAPLAQLAAASLAHAGVGNVVTRVGDGYAGWPETAPFDAILVTAAPDHVPPALVDQLAPGGRLVIPVGREEQDLMVIEKSADGTAHSSVVISVRFVPLTRDR